MAKKQWYQKGKDGVKRSKQEDAAAKARREQRGPRRFWLDNGTSAKATFLDTPAFFLYEHNIKIGKDFHNFFTCIKDLDTCPLCEAKYMPSYIMVGTIINHKKSVDKKGQVHQHEKQLIVLKGQARQNMLRKIKKRGGDITMTRFEMSRGDSSTECATGEDFEFLGKVDKKKLLALKPADVDPKEWLKPFDYEEIFAPKTAKELAKLAGVDAPVGSDSEDEEEEDEFDDAEDTEDEESEDEDEDESDDDDDDADSDDDDDDDDDDDADSDEDEEDEDEESEEDEDIDIEDEDEEEEKSKKSDKKKKKDKGKEKSKSKEPPTKEKSSKKEEKKKSKKDKKGKKGKSVEDLM